jgi:hypothetical protein
MLARAIRVSKTVIVPGLIPFGLAIPILGRPLDRIRVAQKQK